MPRRTKEERAAYMRDYRAGTTIKKPPEVVIRERKIRESKRVARYLIKRRSHNRGKIRWIKERMPCKVCGESHPACLDFHHKNPKDKKFLVSEFNTRSWATVAEEIKKCVVICANCHRKLHDKYSDDIVLDRP